MSVSNRRWPQRDEYQHAVANPSVFLKDQNLKRMQPERRASIGGVSLPLARPGQFGAVYRFEGGGKARAVKVFTSEQQDRELRYRLIHEHLQEIKRLPFLVGFEFQEQGILVNGEWFPVLTMDWAAGERLDEYIERRVLNDPVARAKLCVAWVELVSALRGQGMAHGDLQHGNVLVQPDGRLTLVDYDGMYVRSMARLRLPAPESGLPGYQHCLRRTRRDYFDGRLDDFSALVILLTIAGATTGLWKRFPPDLDGLLFKEADFQQPDRSALFTEFTRSADGAVNKLAVILRSASRGELDAIPSFLDVVSDGRVRPLWSGEPRATPVSPVSPVEPPVRPPPVEPVRPPPVVPVRPPPVGPPNPTPPAEPGFLRGLFEGVLELVDAVTTWVVYVCSLAVAAATIALTVGGNLQYFSTISQESWLRPVLGLAMVILAFPITMIIMAILRKVGRAILGRESKTP
jgi:predicted Ser/Thr protein kinase